MSKQHAPVLKASFCPTSKGRAKGLRRPKKPKEEAKKEEVRDFLEKPRESITALSNLPALSVLVCGSRSKIFDAARYTKPMPIAEVGIVFVTAKELLDKECHLLAEISSEKAAGCGLPGLKGAMASKEHATATRSLKVATQHAESVKSRGFAGAESVLSAAELLGYGLCTPAAMVSCLHHDQKDCIFYCAHPTIREPKYGGDFRHVIKVVVEKSSSFVIAQVLDFADEFVVPIDTLIGFIAPSR
jgi:hypothetical protein